MPNIVYEYNMPKLRLMFMAKYSLKEIVNSDAINPSGCSFSRISEIRKLWKEGKIDCTKIGTLNELRNNNNEIDQQTYILPTYLPDYYQIIFRLLDNYLKIKLRKKNDMAAIYHSKDLKQAYLHFSKILHPDLNKKDPEATEKFKALKEVYNILNKEWFGIDK